MSDEKKAAAPAPEGLSFQPSTVEGVSINYPPALCAPRPALSDEVLREAVEHLDAIDRLIAGIRADSRLKQGQECAVALQAHARRLRAVLARQQEGK